MPNDSALNRPLCPGDFARFYHAIHGREPFSWQNRLATELSDSVEAGGRGGRWPALLDLPTGSGKTTAIEIAVFLMALRDDAPRRVVFLVDRRVVVQQAFSVATELAQKLQQAEGDDSVLATVAGRLRRFTMAAPKQPALPLAVAELRGGIDIDEDWARRPDVPTVLVSTVDQVGSRLLMQGYGVSPRMRPIHAGLLANDVLFLLDEVHLAQPFAQTLEVVGRLRSRGDAVWADSDRWQVSQLSATPGTAPGHLDPPFSLTAEDRLGPLHERLTAHKRARCLSVKASADTEKESAALARAMVDEALDLHRHHEGAVIAVVANRVATASAVARGLRDALGADAGSRVVLLTGRMRPYDRDRALRRFGPRLQSGRHRDATSEPLFLVGTQSIEAGADFDVDVLVTECASLDALKQRFGRVDRLGQLAAAGRAMTSVIVASDRIGKEPDPVYAEASATTWAWLTGLNEVDFGIEHLPPIPAELRARVLAPTQDAPALMSSHLDRWWQTTPPDAVPDVADWLHGPRDQDPDVTVIWRLGLDRCSSRDSDVAARAAAAMMSAIPPLAAEGLSVPLTHVRRWLRGSRPAALFADVEGLTALDDGRDTSDEIESWLIWRPDDPVWTSQPRLIRPGDTVVVDAHRGGLLADTWDPSATDPVSDVSVAASARDDDSQGGAGSGARYVRLLPEVFPGMEPPPPTPHHVLDQSDVAPEDRVDVDDIDQVAAVRQWCEDVAARTEVPVVAVTTQSETDRDHLMWLAARGLLFDADVLTLGVAGASWYLVRYVPKDARRVGLSDRTDASSAAGEEVTLEQHLADAARWAAAFVADTGLPPSTAAAVIEAARWHDLGKVDDRFQRQLHDGAVPVTSVLLAKSVIPPWSRARWERARREAGYPSGERHEMFSVSLLDQVLAEDETSDTRMVRYLVGTHHGHGRPFVLPAAKRGLEVGTVHAVVLDHSVDLKGHHGFDRDDSAVPQRFWEMIRAHGWFATAWLEALTRLADHRASEFPGSAQEPNHE